MRFIIIIPTRNRPDTIQHAIQTVTAQNYHNYRLIICDNSTNDETKNLINNLDNSLIEYHRTDSDLCMSYNWELALSLIGSDEGYVHVMGDDNGLMPNSLNEVSRLLKSNKSSAVVSNPCDFTWPNDYDNCGQLFVPFETEILIVNSNKALKESFRMRLGFSKLPNINMAFVHTDVINKVKSAQNGRYFVASNPDVYSALVNSLFCDSYIYSFKPFLINGGSKHSNGVNTQKNHLNTNAFIQGNISNGYSYHWAFPPSTSWYLNVYESYARLIELYGIDYPQLKLYPNKILSRMVKYEFYKRGRYWLKGDIEAFARSYNLKIPKLNKPVSKSQSLNTKADSNGHYITSKDLKDIYSASIFSDVLLNNLNTIRRNPISHLKFYLLTKLKRTYFKKKCEL